MTDRRIVFVTAALVTGTWMAAAAGRGPIPEQEPVAAIAPPASPLPPEADSAAVTRFSFLAYGDTRGSRDGVELQYNHSLVVDSMLATITRLATSPAPVAFVLQSGDAVANGALARQWNVSFTPLVDRLTTQGGVSYFLVPGNHDVSGAQSVGVPGRQPGLHNYLEAMAKLLPPDGSPRRLPGYPSYAFGYGNTFVLGLDADVAGDDTQFAWVKAQFEGLDRARFPNIVVFCHQAPFSSGPHGGPNVEAATVALRARYMPLFRAHHVRLVLSGHEHLFEHWIERYTDGDTRHRMDLVVSGGGGAPIYTYSGEPDLREYLRANQASHVTVEHLVKPGTDPGQNPYHYLIVRVDGTRIDLQVVGVDWGKNFAPYHGSGTSLQDPGGR